MDNFFSDLQNTHKSNLCQVESFIKISKKLYSLQEVIIKECNSISELIQFNEDNRIYTFKKFLKSYIKQAEIIYKESQSSYGLLNTTKEAINNARDLLNLDEAECCKLLKQGISDEKLLEKYTNRAINTSNASLVKTITDLSLCLNRYSKSFNSLLNDYSSNANNLSKTEKHSQVLLRNNSILKEISNKHKSKQFKNSPKAAERENTRSRRSSSSTIKFSPRLCF